MKKFFSVAIVAAAVATMMSCSNNPKPSLKNDVDTLSYAIGVVQSQGLMDYLANAKGVDTTYIAEFLQGVNDGAKAGDDKKKAAYFAGIEIGQQISNNMMKGLNYNLFGEDSTQSVSMNNFLAGFVSSVTGKDCKLTVAEAGCCLRASRPRALRRSMQPTRKRVPSSWLRMPRRKVCRPCLAVCSTRC